MSMYVSKNVSMKKRAG